MIFHNGFGIAITVSLDNLGSVPKHGHNSKSTAGKRLFLLLLIFIGLAFLATWALTRAATRHPVALLFIGRTNDNTGDEVVHFCLTNRTSRPVVFVGDATGLPYYFLTAERGVDSATHLILLTNYNQQQFFTAKAATLPPVSSVTFPVRVPKEATGAVLRLNYMRQAGWFGEFYRHVFLAVRGRSSEPYQNLELQQPFHEHVAE